jgi:hypothetical protein
VKTEGAARISAVVSAGRGQKKAGMENPLSDVVVCRFVGSGGDVRFGEVDKNDLSCGRGLFSRQHAVANDVLPNSDCHHGHWPNSFFHAYASWPRRAWARNVISTGPTERAREPIQGLAVLGYATV